MAAVWICYLCLGGYIIVVVCVLGALHKNFRTDLHGIFSVYWQWTNEQTIKFWWQFGSRIQILRRPEDQDQHQVEMYFSKTISRPLIQDQDKRH